MTALATRTDHHRAASTDFDPTAYTYIASFDLNPDDAWANSENADRAETIRRYTDRGYRYADCGPKNGMGQCGHCGTRIRYAALLARTETKELLYVGETCLGTTFASESAADFKAVRAAAAARRDQVRAVGRFQANLEDAITRSWLLEILGNPAACGNVSDFCASIRANLFRGPLTDRQVSALTDSLDRHYAAEERRRDRETDRIENSVAAPTGKATVTGEIIKTAVQDNHYGPGITRKMFVRDNRGFTVYATVPAALADRVTMTRDLVGATLTFTATLTRSDRDETFAFASRPSKVSVISPSAAMTETVEQ